MSIRQDLRAARKGALPLPVFVERYCGSRNSRLVRAVGDLAQSTDSPLDLTNLELLAAAAPFLDADRLANLVEQLPRTEAPTNVNEIDIATARPSSLRSSDLPLPHRTPIRAASASHPTTSRSVLRQLAVDPRTSDTPRECRGRRPGGDRRRSQRPGQSGGCRQPVHQRDRPRCPRQPCQPVPAMDGSHEPWHLGVKPAGLGTEPRARGPPSACQEPAPAARFVARPPRERRSFGSLGCRREPQPVRPGTRPQAPGGLLLDA
jgi:hypothetical protein